MDVAFDYHPLQDGAPISIRGVKPGVWLYYCRSCSRTGMEATQHDALMTGTTHLFLSPMWGCGASQAAAHRQASKENAK